MSTISIANPKTLTMCRMVTVYNPASSQSTVVAMFIDAGSTDTYITDRLAKELDLTCGNEQPLNIARFLDNVKTNGQPTTLGIYTKEKEGFPIKAFKLAQDIKVCPDMHVVDLEDGELELIER
jgi:hypothetical protein